MTFRFVGLSWIHVNGHEWRTNMVPKNTICLWYDGTALDAAKFYAETFPDSAVGTVHRAPGDYPAGKLFVRYTYELVTDMDRFQQMITTGERGDTP